MLLGSPSLSLEELDRSDRLRHQYCSILGLILGLFWSLKNLPHDPENFMLSQPELSGLCPKPSGRC